MRLIDADALIKKFMNVCRTEFEVKNKCMTDENALHLIYDVPTVEPTITCKECDGYEAGYSAGQHDARPKGGWIGKAGEYYCNKCYGKLWYRSDYCPQCGADMRGGRE